MCFIFQSLQIGQKSEPGSQQEPTPSTISDAAPPLSRLSDLHGSSVTQPHIKQKDDSAPTPSASRTETASAWIESDSDDSDEPKPKKTALEDLFGSDVLIAGVSGPTIQSLQSQIDDEIARYRKEIPIPLKDSATDWWRKKSCQYPLLGKLAQCYLAIPGTSVPSERIFSTAGDVVTALRTNLKPKNVDMLVFLNKNLEL